MRKKKKAPLHLFFFFFSRLLQVVLFAHAFATSLHQDRKVRSFRGLLASLSKVRGGGEGRIFIMCALLRRGLLRFPFLSPCARRATLEPNCVVRKKKKSSLFFSFLLIS
uniref:Putative secreted protein n=1 Tax=Ixodes ricinus TaxID=34613 RepID=A0A6B0UI10_IXORI